MIVEKMLELHKFIQNPSLDEIFEIDKEVRAKTLAEANKAKAKTAPKENLNFIAQLLTYSYKQHYNRFL